MHIKSDRTNKTSAEFQSTEFGLHSRVGIFPCPYWLLCNLSVKLADHENFIDPCYVGGYCRRSILKNGIPSRGFFGLVFLGVFGSNFKAIRKVCMGNLELIVKIIILSLTREKKKLKILADEGSARIS